MRSDQGMSPISQNRYICEDVANMLSFKNKKKKKKRILKIEKKGEKNRNKKAVHHGIMENKVYEIY